MTMRTLKLTLQYDGTDFVGWQRQPDGVSIQGLVEDALAAFEDGPVTVHGAGRTDAGVHALAQVASASMAAAHAPEALQRGLNVSLPPAVRVLDVAEMPPGFHARFDATGKVYEYRIINAPFASPFLYRYTWLVPRPLDLGAMRAAAGHLVGTHDFAAFQGTGTEVISTRRTIKRLELEPGDGPCRPLILRVEGDGFLRHMVRNVAGTLVEIGAGRWPPSMIEEILASRDRRTAGRAAPASGLFLAAVTYAQP